MQTIDSIKQARSNENLIFDTTWSDHLFIIQFISLSSQLLQINIKQSRSSLQYTSQEDEQLDERRAPNKNKNFYAQKVENFDTQRLIDTKTNGNEKVAIEHIG